MADLVETKVNFKNSEDIKAVYADRYNFYSLSRYKKKSIIYDSVVQYSTMYPEDMAVKTDNYTSYIVKRSDCNRLDLIAHRFYGDASLFWVIAYYNNIMNPFNIPVGMELKIPDRSALYKSGGVLG